MPTQKNDVVETRQDVTNGFDEFYERYPKKPGPKKSRPAWIKNKCSLLVEKIMNDLSEREKCENWIPGNEFVPLPTTYLNGHSWEAVDKTVGASKNKKLIGATKAQELDELREKLKRDREAINEIIGE